MPCCDIFCRLTDYSYLARCVSFIKMTPALHHNNCLAFHVSKHKFSSMSMYCHQKECTYIYQNHITLKKYSKAKSQADLCYLCNCMYYHLHVKLLYANQYYMLFVLSYQFYFVLPITACSYYLMGDNYINIAFDHIYKIIF